MSHPHPELGSPPPLLEAADDETARLLDTLGTVS